MKCTTDILTLLSPGQTLLSSVIFFTRERERDREREIKQSKHALISSEEMMSRHVAIFAKTSFWFVTPRSKVLILISKTNTLRLALEFITPCLSHSVYNKFLSFLSRTLEQGFWRRERDDRKKEVKGRKNEHGDWAARLVEEDGTELLIISYVKMRPSQATTPPADICDNDR